jgi:hypothetical protein
MGYHAKANFSLNDKNDFQIFSNRKKVIKLNKE